MELLASVTGEVVIQITAEAHIRVPSSLIMGLVIYLTSKDFFFREGSFYVKGEEADITNLRSIISSGFSEYFKGEICSNLSGKKKKKKGKNPPGEWKESAELSAEIFCKALNIEMKDDSISVEGYEVKKFLGAGGQGFIFLVQKDEDDFCCKYFKSNVPNWEVRMKREFNSLSILQGTQGIPCAVQCYEDFFVMDFIPNSKPLEELSGPLEEKVALDLLHKLLDIVKACHDKGVLHRDISHKNILRTETNEIFLIDFGLSVLIEAGNESDEFTKAGDSLRNALLFLPEYSGGVDRGGKRKHVSDLTLVAAVFFYLLSKEDKMELSSDCGTKDPKSKMAPLSSNWSFCVRLFFLKAFQYKLEDRFQDIEEMKQILSLSKQQAIDEIAELNSQRPQSSTTPEHVTYLAIQLRGYWRMKFKTDPSHKKSWKVSKAVKLHPENNFDYIITIGRNDLNISYVFDDITKVCRYTGKVASWQTEAFGVDQSGNGDCVELK